MAANDTVQFKDLPDIRLYVKIADLPSYLGAYVLNNAAGSIVASSAGTLFTFNQQGAGPIVDFDQGGNLKVRIANSGQIQSSVATGTAPLTVASTTVVTNLNVDKVDGLDGTQFVRNDASGTITVNAAGTLLTINQTGAGAILGLQQGGSAKVTFLNSGQIQSHLLTGTAPFVIASTTVSNNLNADLVDGIHGTQLLRKDISDTATSPLNISGAGSSILNFVDTIGQDYSMALSGNLLTLYNLSSSAGTTFGTNPVQEINPTGSSDTAIKINMFGTSTSVSAIEIDNSGVSNFIIRNGGEVRVPVGHPASTSNIPSKQMTLGGQAWQDTTQAFNSGAGETDLHSYTIDGYTLANDGDSLEINFSGFFANNANAKQLRLYFGGTTIVDTGSVAFQNRSWCVQGSIVRISSSAIRAMLILVVGQAGTGLANTRAEVFAGTVTGLSLTGSNNLKSTGQGVASNDISTDCSLVRKFGRGQ